MAEQIGRIKRKNANHSTGEVIKTTDGQYMR